MGRFKLVCILLPANMQHMLPSKRAILDATYVPIQRPTHRNAHVVAFWRVTDEMLRKEFTSKVLLAVSKHSKFRRKPSTVSIHAWVAGSYMCASRYDSIIIPSCVYSKQPIFGLTQQWLRELSFSRLEYGVHDKLHISCADWRDILLPLA